MIEAKHYTWEEKIESLVKLAKATGAFLHLLDDRDYDSHTYRKMRQNILEAYDEFCDWRHEEPYVVDEIQGLLGRKEYKDAQTGIRLTVERDNPEHPDYPKLTIICPTERTLPLEEINEAMGRLMDRAGIAPQHRMPPVFYTD